MTVRDSDKNKTKHKNKRGNRGVKEQLLHLTNSTLKEMCVYRKDPANDDDYD